MFQSLGISALAAIVNKTTPTNKAALVNKTTATKKAMARENSDSLYEPGDSDDNEQGVVDKVFLLLSFQSYCSFVFSMQKD